MYLTAPEFEPPYRSVKTVRLIVKRIFIGACGAALLASQVGCAVPLHQMTPDLLCQHYGNNSMTQTDRVPLIRKELEQRQILTDAEWKLADSGSFDFNVSRCAMFAIKGTPYAINNTHTKEGTRTQYAFIDKYGKRNYVYTMNGKVTSWQD